MKIFQKIQDYRSTNNEILKEDFLKILTMLSSNNVRVTIDY